MCPCVFAVSSVLRSTKMCHVSTFMYTNMPARVCMYVCVGLTKSRTLLTRPQLSGAARQIRTTHKCWRRAQSRRTAGRHCTTTQTNIRTLSHCVDTFSFVGRLPRHTLRTIARNSSMQLRLCCVPPMAFIDTRHHHHRRRRRPRAHKRITHGKEPNTQVQRNAQRYHAGICTVNIYTYILVNV